MPDSLLRRFHTDKQDVPTVSLQQTAVPLASDKIRTLEETDLPIGNVLLHVDRDPEWKFERVSFRESFGLIPGLPDEIIRVLPAGCQFCLERSDRFGVRSD